MLIVTAVLAQPTPREQRYICSWNGVSIREHADMKSKQIAYLNYGDSVAIYPQQRQKDTVNMSICAGHSVTKNTTKTIFPAWSEAADWIPIYSKKGRGFVPSLYLSKQPPLLVDTTTQRPRESINEYFFRTRGLLEGKSVHRKIEDIGRYFRRHVFPLCDVNRSVYPGGAVFEWRYAAADHDNFMLILLDWSLVEAYHFLNAFYNLEAKQQRGFDDTIRLITKEENRLVFSNNYEGGGKKGKPRKQFMIQRINETIIITKEEVYVD